MKKRISFFLLATAALAIPTGAFAATCVLSNNTQSLGDSVGTTGQSCVAQMFTVASDCTPSQATVQLKSTGSPAGNDLHVDIYSDSSGPGSSLLASNAASVTVDGTYHMVTATYSSSVTLHSGSTYWAVIKTSAANSGSNYYIAGMTSSLSTLGAHDYSNGSCTGWNPDSPHSFSFLQIDDSGGGGGGGGSATSTPYIPTKQEWTFLVMIAVFFTAVPFWERVLHLKGRER